MKFMLVKTIWLPEVSIALSVSDLSFSIENLPVNEEGHLHTMTEFKCTVVDLRVVTHDIKEHHDSAGLVGIEVTFDRDSCICMENGCIKYSFSQIFELTCINDTFGRILNI